MQEMKIVDTNANDIMKFGICGYKNAKREGYLEKIEWVKQGFSYGLKIKTLISERDGNQGMIEYIPGEFAWRPVKAPGYIFIHCIFLGFKREYKGKGYGSQLLKECVKDAKEQGSYGVAVITRKGSFMAGKELFIKNGFTIFDQAQPDFELLVMKFNKKAISPKFNGNWGKRLTRYGSNLTIIRADQCPYTVKNVREIAEVSENSYGIEPVVIHLKNYAEAQETPCPFGIFCILFKGRVIANHPISKTRFQNIMRDVLEGEKDAK